MSPKKWFLGGVISLGTFLGLIDGSNAIFTLGGSLLSFAGASVAAGYGAMAAWAKTKIKNKKQQNFNQFIHMVEEGTKFLVDLKG